MTKPKKRILLVEDDAALNDAFSILLKKEHYTVDSVFNGREALEKLTSTVPDLILLDLLMPIMDGKVFLKNFKNTSKVPIIVFSNLDAKTEVNEALALGATRYMLKAWASPKELIRVIKDTIGD